MPAPQRPPTAGMMRGVGFNDCNYVVDVVVDYDRMVLIRSYRVGIGGSVISVAPV